jgi:hypothetical protein
MNQRVRFASREPALGWIGDLANSQAVVRALKRAISDRRIWHRRAPCSLSLGLRGNYELSHQCVIWRMGEWASMTLRLPVTLA